MKVVVVGGSGLVGRQVIQLLHKKGVEAVSASPSTGVNTITGDGLDAALKDAQLVVDLSNAPAFDEASATAFFRTSTTNLLKAELGANVKHHVAVSIVGINTPRLPGVGYMASKVIQEDLIASGGVPFSIIQATQFMEFVAAIVGSLVTDDGIIHAPDALLQPIASADLAAIVAEVALAAPLNGKVEVAGPDRLKFGDIAARYFKSKKEVKQIVIDDSVGYFGTPIQNDSLVPLEGASARIGKTSFGDFLATSA